MRFSAARREALTSDAGPVAVTAPCGSSTHGHCWLQRRKRAHLACRFSIHVQPKSLDKHALKRATEAFPLSIEGCNDCFHCGFHAESSYGAASYFIKRDNGGNILMDSPRWNPTLARRLEAMGGVRYMVLSHQDDVAGAAPGDAVSRQPCYNGEVLHAWLRSQCIASRRTTVRTPRSSEMDGLLWV